MKIVLISFCFLLFCCSSSVRQQPVPFTSKTENIAVVDSAMVVCARTEAAKVGLDILRKGGNAIDAAIAVQFTLAVVYPNAGNIGGGGFMVIRKNNGEINALDFREKAPERSTKNMFINPYTDEVDRAKIETSHLASGVPGTVDGMWTAHQKYGSLPWADLIQPAIDIAKKGFIITERQAIELTAMQAELKKLNGYKSYFIKDAWKKGDTIVQYDLSTTLERIRNSGREGFYSGYTAERLIRDMMLHGGIITESDLKNYHSVWREPVTGTYKNYRIISMPPPSSGGIALIQLLNSVENFPMKEWGQNSVQSIHLMVEAEKWVYADRATWLGDPDFVKIPVAELTDKNYAVSRMADFKENKIKPAKEIQAGIFPGYESTETTHFSIIDQHGNAVAVTTTLNDSYGSRITVNGCGFFLNNEMDDFSAKPGSPNLYGLIGGEANAIAPGKRMLSSMTPTIVLKDDQLFMVVGTPGGSTIITSVFQNIINVVEYDMHMQESVSAPRFHNQWLPDEIKMEMAGFPQEILTGVKRLGYKITNDDAFGRVDAILVTYDQAGNRILEGGADPRGDDAAMGY